MSRLLCCLRARDMGAALSHPQEGDACDGVTVAPPTMADVIRERKKKAGGAGLGTLRRRLAAAARRPRDSRPDRGCEHARYIRSVVSSWSLADVFLLCEQLEGGAALRDLATQAELAREPAPALHADLGALRARWWCDVELAGAGWALGAHRALLAARCPHLRELLARHPGAARVPLEGAAAALSREEAEACVAALYSDQRAPRRTLCDACSKWEKASEAELDIISVENSTLRSCGRCGRGRGRTGASAVRTRAPELLPTGPLARDLRRMLDSGAGADTRLWWAAEGAAFGFRSALELPAHRCVLAARSRYFRSVLSRQRGAVCVDEQVLPRRFARALLHAAYTDQVDLSLIGRISTSPSSTTSSGSTGTLRGNSSRSSTTQMLDDAFQLYEIARFLEMPIVVQGCEDAVARALSADTLPHVLRWSAGAHASRWIHRQAMRYLRDEFPAVMAAAGAGRLPRAALADALASPFLQASEPAALRALLRWAERAAAPPPAREPNVVWHTAHAGRRARAGRGARAGDGAVRAALGPLAPLVRAEHLPPAADSTLQAVRRGVLPAPAVEEGGAADAWLGRGSYRPARCFLPYLDELKALLEDQEVPEAELARARRQRYLHRIPDTLYMVRAARETGAGDGDGATSACVEGVSLCVGARTLASLRARVRELRASPPAARALALHAPDTAPVRRQIALRAVRELSLPDACAELLLNEPDPSEDREGSEWEAENAEGSDTGDRRADADDCCSRSGSGSLRCASAGSLRAGAALAPAPGGAWAGGPGVARREGSRPPTLDAQRRAGWRGRLSAAVPDVAMAPNANTHLLSARDMLYSGQHAHAHAHTLAHPHAPVEVGGLQLDLGDGATHTPRPGSRAQRAYSRHRDVPQAGGALPRRDDLESRTAFELTARAFPSAGPRRLPARPADLLPDEFAVRTRASPSPSSLSGHAGPGGQAGHPAHAGLAGHAGTAPRRRPGAHTPPPRLSLGGGSLALSEAGGRSPSPRRSPAALYALYAHAPRHSRGHSPNYA